MAENNDNLDDFFTFLKNGTTVESFLSQFREIMGFIHARGLTKDYRLGKGKVKKLRDEVSPVARFVRAHATPEDRIRFALDKTYPDCIVHLQDGRKREIEITVVRSRERSVLMKKLNEDGDGHGLVNLPDDAAFQCFKKTIPQGYSTEEEVARRIVHAVELSAERKGTHRGHTLLIEVVPDMNMLTDDWWDSIQTFLSDNATVKALGFSEAYVTGLYDRDGLCLRIK